MPKGRTAPGHPCRADVAFPNAMTLNERASPTDDSIAAPRLAKRPMTMDGRTGQILLTTITAGLLVLVPALADGPDADAFRGGSVAFSVMADDRPAVRPLGPPLALPAWPGESRVQSIIVRNDGPALTYSLRIEATDVDGLGLRDALTATIRVGVADCDGSEGPILYAGPLAGATVGDPAFGRQSGDRSLRAGASERLCIWSMLPISMGDAFQGASTTAKVMVAAEPAW